MRRFGIAQSFLRVAFEQRRDDRSGVGGQRRRVLEPVGEHVVRDVGAVVRVERRSEGVQLVDENAHRPPVDVQVVRLATVDLVGDVFRRAAQSSRSVVVVDVLLRQPEVAQFRVSVVEEENVLRFQIPIDLDETSRREERRTGRETNDFLRVEEEKGAGHLPDVEEDLFLSERFRRLELEEIVERARSRHFHEEEQSFGVLKGVEKLDDERIRLRLNENVAFRPNVRQTLSLQNQILPQTFHRVEVAAVTNQIDLPRDEERCFTRSVNAEERRTAPVIPLPNVRRNSI